MPSSVPSRSFRRSVKTVRQLVKAVGGGRRVAVDLSVGRSTVYAWIKANEVPRQYEMPLMRLGRRCGVLWVPRSLEDPDLVIAWRTPTPEKKATAPVVPTEIYWPARLRA
jgi:hypothetical protein